MAQVARQAPIMGFSQDWGSFCRRHDALLEAVKMEVGDEDPTVVNSEHTSCIEGLHRLCPADPAESTQEPSSAEQGDVTPRKKAQTPKTVPGGPCAHCGAVESPQWRRPVNKKVVLCNACGIFYSRHQKLPKRKPVSTSKQAEKCPGGAESDQLTTEAEEEPRTPSRAPWAGAPLAMALHDDAAAASGSEATPDARQHNPFTCHHPFHSSSAAALRDGGLHGLFGPSLLTAVLQQQAQALAAAQLAVAQAQAQQLLASSIQQTSSSSAATHSLAADGCPAASGSTSPTSAAGSVSTSPAVSGATAAAAGQADGRPDCEPCSANAGNSKGSNCGSDRTTAVFGGAAAGVPAVATTAASTVAAVAAFRGPGLLASLRMAQPAAKRALDAVEDLGSAKRMRGDSPFRPTPTSGPSSAVPPAPQQAALLPVTRSPGPRTTPFIPAARGPSSATPTPSLLGGHLPLSPQVMAPAAVMAALHQHGPSPSVPEHHALGLRHGSAQHADVVTGSGYEPASSTAAAQHISHLQASGLGLHQGAAAAHVGAASPQMAAAPAMGAGMVHPGSLMFLPAVTCRGPRGRLARVV